MLDTFKADAQSQLDEGSSREEVSVRWEVSVEAVDWILEDRWPRIAGVADRGWSVLSMIRESRWYSRNGLVQVHRGGMATIDCYWHRPAPRVVHELEKAARDADIRVVHRDSPWSQEDVETRIDSVLAVLATSDHDLIVHDCLLQPDGLYFAITCSDNDLEFDDLVALSPPQRNGVPVFWGVGPKLRALDSF